MDCVAQVITKSLPVFVRPSESELPMTPPSDGNTVPLSCFDKCMPSFPVMLLLTFHRPIRDPVGTIKAALSRALAHYYRPLAGRIDGRGGIACTDDGAAFVAASASCALEDAPEALLQMDLTVRYPGAMRCRDADPLVQVQVTEFSCGGFAVGVTWNHMAADGAGMGQFLLAVGELVRGVPPPTPPVRRWDGGASLPSSTIAAQKSTLDQEPQRLARLDLTVPASLIARVVVESGGGCTVFEAITAVLWRCRTRATATVTPDDSPAPLTFPRNVRAQVGAPPGYYGNCVSMVVVSATSATVAGSGIGDLARRIRRAKEENKMVMLSSNSSSSNRAPLWYEAFTVTSWRNLGLDAADFGGGAPARVLWHAEQTMVPGCVVCPPCNRGADHGVDVSALCVKPEHVHAFLQELASLDAAAASI